MSAAEAALAELRRLHERSAFLPYWCTCGKPHRECPDVAILDRYEESKPTGKERADG